MMVDGRDDRVRQKAYEIWEREGRPEGKQREHWEQAEREAAAEEVIAATPKRRARATASNPKTATAKKPKAESAAAAKKPKPAARRSPAKK